MNQVNDTLLIYFAACTTSLILGLVAAVGLTSRTIKTPRVTRMLIIIILIFIFIFFLILSYINQPNN